MPPRTRGAAAARGRTWERIWSVVRCIPRGRVATYGQVAAAAGFASQPRLAGYALHALPAHSAVPWHRVINARGRISLSPLDGHYQLQRSMLEAEGVVFAGERVDLARYGWKAARRAPSAAARARAARTGGTMTRKARTHTVQTRGPRTVKRARRRAARRGAT